MYYSREEYSSIFYEPICGLFCGMVWYGNLNLYGYSCYIVGTYTDAGISTKITAIRTYPRTTMYAFGLSSRGQEQGGAKKVNTTTKHR